jgi:hypothetical protein
MPFDSNMPLTGEQNIRASITPLIMFAKIDTARDHSTSIEILEVIKSARPSRIKGMKSILAHLWKKKRPAATTIFIAK